MEYISSWDVLEFTNRDHVQNRPKKISFGKRGLKYLKVRDGSRIMPMRLML